jgi:protease-4
MMDSQFKKAYASSQGNIGVVEITGMIFSSKKIIRDIQTFRENDDIKAIILRIDSPGGGIGPSQEIYREIMKTRSDKKIITSMGSVAASGGYYIASASDGIVANPGTLTGSIGVIMEYANIMEIAKKIGISPVVIKSGEFKDMGSPLRELKEPEKKIFQELVDELHYQFVSDAAKARNINIQTMSALADGRVYTGQKALKLKLVDRLGNLDDAVQWAGEIANIEGELKPVYPKEDKISFIKRLAETLFKDIDITGTVTDNLRYVIN